MNKRISPWTVIISAVIGAVAIAIAQNKVLPCINMLETHFHIGMTSVGWLSSVFSVMGIVMAFPAVAIVDRLGVRNSCLLSVACCMVGAALGLVSMNFYAMLFSRVMEGVGAGLISIAVPNLIVAWFPPEKRGIPTGLWTSWQYVGQAICFSAGTIISANFGWKGVWLFGFTIAAAALALNYLFVDSSRERCLPDKEQSPRKAEKNMGSKTVFCALSNKNAWLISVSAFCFNFCAFALITWAVSYWADALELNVAAGNSYISLFAAISIPMVLFVGWILDRINQRRFGIGVFLLYAVVASGAFLLPSSGWVMVFVLMYPFAESSVITTLWALISQVSRNKTVINSAVAMLTLGSNIGMLVGPPVAGAGISILGWGAAVVLILSVSLLGSICLMFVEKLPANTALL